MYLYVHTYTYMCMYVNLCEVYRRWGNLLKPFASPFTGRSAHLARVFFQAASSSACALPGDLKIECLCLRRVGAADEGPAEGVGERANKGSRILHRFGKFLPPDNAPARETHELAGKF